MAVVVHPPPAAGIPHPVCVRHPRLSFASVPMADIICMKLVPKF